MPILSLASNQPERVHQDMSGFLLNETVYPVAKGQSLTNSWLYWLRRIVFAAPMLSYLS